MSFSYQVCDYLNDSRLITFRVESAHIQARWLLALKHTVSHLQIHCTHHPNPLPHPPTQTVRYESLAHDLSPNVGIMGATAVNSQHLAIYFVIKERSQVWLQRQNAPAVAPCSRVQQHEISMLLRGNAKVGESLPQSSIANISQEIQYTVHFTIERYV